MNAAFDRALQEARTDWNSGATRHIDWALVGKGLFSRIEEEQRLERASLAKERTQSHWKPFVAALAVAAAGAVVFVNARGTQLLEADRAAADDGGSIVAIDGGGEVLLDGRRATVGAMVRMGDVIETVDANATLGRAGKLTLVLERGSKATVTHVHGALVLALARGALEAQVVSVATGEALAIDVGPSRVAVHGTHLRVARTDDRVVVDLNEGIVSVGAAPRVGSTLGALVAAPAHAEFSAADAQATLLVTHDLAQVRGPVALSPAPKLGAGAVSPPPATSRTEARESPSISAQPRIESHSPQATAGSQAVPPPDPNAQGVVEAAVRACINERPHSDEVTVVVSTTLYLQVDDDGSVRSARFDPPVALDVNACAARSIYKTHFPHGGTATIPILVKN